MNSPEISFQVDKLFHSDFNNRIESLQTEVQTQLESPSKNSASLQQIVHSIPIIFRSLRNNLQSQQKLFAEYNELTHISQKVIAICTQYIHDRHDHENRLLFIKDKISQTIGRIGYGQYCLEQYWMMIHSLEHEIERLQLLLSNPQLLQDNRERVRTFQENQKIKLDRLVKENEHLKNLIHQRKDSIRSMQLQIEVDIQELRTLQSVLHKKKFEQKHVQKHLLQLDNQSSHLKNVMEQTNNMENEYHDRMKLTTCQYDLMQKQLDSLSDTYEHTNQKLSTVETNETDIKQEIENVKKKINTEQVNLMIYREQITNLRQQSLKLTSHYLHLRHLVKSKKHTNSVLDRKCLSLEHNQRKLADRIRNLANRLTQTVEHNQQYEHLIQINLSHMEDQQYRTTKMQMSLKKIIHVNNNLEKILRENRLIRSSEQNKLHSMKQLSYQKHKQLIQHTKHLHILFIDQHRLTNNIIRNSLDIVRFNSICHEFINTEKYFEQSIRTKKTELMNHEKHRASLSRDLHDNVNKIHFLTKKNQLIENELQSKIDQFKSLQHYDLQQKHHRLVLFNKKQLAMYSSQQKAMSVNELHKKYHQLEKLSDNEINRIRKKEEENERLKCDIQRLQQQVANMISRNKRQIDESSLLHEKIRLYTQINDGISQQEQQYSCHIHRLTRRIIDLQQENNRSSDTIGNLQRKSLDIVSSRYNQVQQKVNIHRMNQIISDRSISVRNRSVQVDAEKIVNAYSTSVNQLVKIIYQVARWREKLVWITQLYSTKMAKVQQQMKLLAGNNEMILRNRINSEIRQYKAIKAECYMQTLPLSAQTDGTYL
ncbi:unnamed protein product [Adineta ricciae]|uniref:Uncharacterized protein n=1 Tax=Adineta ricciae TaxID=249248 RepID=A0A813TH03_ADIRI|nr:unnamed protein product [Adineta ricciae]CAF1254324.1 unnamed protein product [Adineta ricciae]